MRLPSSVALETYTQTNILLGTVRALNAHPFTILSDFYPVPARSNIRVLDTYRFLIIYIILVSIYFIYLAFFHELSDKQKG